MLLSHRGESGPNIVMHAKCELVFRVLGTNGRKKIYSHVLSLVLFSFAHDRKGTRMFPHSQRTKLCLNSYTCMMYNTFQYNLFQSCRYLKLCVVILSADVEYI